MASRVYRPARVYDSGREFLQEILLGTHTASGDACFIARGQFGFQEACELAAGVQPLGNGYQGDVFELWLGEQRLAAKIARTSHPMLFERARLEQQLFMLPGVAGASVCGMYAACSAPLFIVRHDPVKGALRYPALVTLLEHSGVALSSLAAKDELLAQRRCAARGGHDLRHGQLQVRAQSSSGAGAAACMSLAMHAMSPPAPRARHTQHLFCPRPSLTPARVAFGSNPLSISLCNKLASALSKFHRKTHFAHCDVKLVSGPRAAVCCTGGLLARAAACLHVRRLLWGACALLTQSVRRAGDTRARPPAAGQHPVGPEGDGRLARRPGRRHELPEVRAWGGPTHSMHRMHSSACAHACCTSPLPPQPRQVLPRPLRLPLFPPAPSSPEELGVLYTKCYLPPDVVAESIPVATTLTRYDALRLRMWDCFSLARTLLLVLFTAMKWSEWPWWQGACALQCGSDAPALLALPAAMLRQGAGDRLGRGTGGSVG